MTLVETTSRPNAWSMKVSSALRRYEQAPSTRNQYTCGRCDCHHHGWRVLRRPKATCAKQIPRRLLLLGLSRSNFTVLYRNFAAKQVCQGPGRYTLRLGCSMLTSGAISGPLTSLEMTEPTMYIPRSHSKYTFSFAVATALAILAGCSEKMVSPPPGVAASNGAAAQGPTGNAPKQAPGQPNAQPTATPAGGPVTVTAEKAQLRDMPVVLKTTGTVISLASVDVRSQVSSTVTKVHIQEGLSLIHI